MTPAKFSTDRRGAATSKPRTLVATAPSARAPRTASHCESETDSTAGMNTSTTAPCTNPIAAAAMARPVSKADTPAGLASISRSMPNSRSYTVEIAVSMEPKSAAMTTTPG